MITPEKSFLAEKYGPMPVWGWMGIVLGMALVYSTWRKNKQAIAATQATTTPNAVGGQALPSNIVPQYTFVDESTTNIHIPPLGGRPPDQPAPTPPPAPAPAPKPVTIDLGAWLSGLLPHVVPQPRPPAPPPAPAGHWDTVTKFPSPKGTLWGLAVSSYGNGTQWGRIWNAPQNTALKNRRGVPEHIQPGDRFWIPA